MSWNFDAETWECDNCDDLTDSVIVVYGSTVSRLVKPDGATLPPLVATRGTSLCRPCFDETRQPSAATVSSC